MRIRPFILSLLLTLLCAIPALATDITISSTTVSNWVGPTTGVELRGFLSSTLTVPSGTPLAFTANSTTDLLTVPGHSLVTGNAIYLTIGSGGVLPTGLSEGVRYYVISVSGNDISISLTAGGSAINFTSNGSGTIYVLTQTTSYPASTPTTGVTAWRWTCTVSSSVVGGLTVYTLTIPSITIPATTNAVSGYGARWQFWFFKSTGTKIGEWSGYSNLRIPTSAVSTSWDAIKIYNNDTVAAADTSTYTKTEIDALLISCCSGGGGGAGSSYVRVQEEGVDLTQRTTLNFVGSGFTAADNSTRTNVTLDSDLNTISQLATQGVLVRSDSTNYFTRSVTGRLDQITVTNGNGVSGNIELKIPDVLVLGQDGLQGILTLRKAGSSLSSSIQPSESLSTSYVLTLPTSLPGSTSCLQFSTTGVGTWSSTCGSGGGGGAPTNAQYLMVAVNGTLTDERVLANGSGITSTDGGAGNSLTIAVDQSSSFAPTWGGKHIFQSGTNTTSVESVRIGKADRTTNGQTDSDYIAFYGKGRDSSVNYTAEWRVKVDVIANTGESTLSFLNRINSGALSEWMSISPSGLVTGAGLTAGTVAVPGGVEVINSSGNLLVTAFAAASLSGNNAKLVTTTGTLTSGRCAEWDANGNLIQSAGACSGGSAPAGSTGDYQINNAGALGAGQLKDLSGGAISITYSSSGGTFRAIPDSPATITSNQNNLTITGRSLNLRLATDAQRIIRGLTFDGFTQVDGEWHLISNVGSFPFDLTNEDASATAGNRFTTASGKTVTLLPNRAALAAYETSTNRWRLHPLAVNAPETLHTNTAAVNISSSVSELSMLSSTFTTPANFWTVGKVMHIKIIGTVNSQVSPPTLQIRLKAGSTLLANSGAVTITTLNGTARVFVLDLTLTCTGTGGSGVFDGNGQFRYNTGANSNMSTLEIPNTFASLDTTTTQTFNVTAQWGTNNASNALSITSAYAVVY